MEWLDIRFVTIAKEEAWSKWLRLLQLIYDPSTDKDGDIDNADGSNVDNNLIDVEIFDDTEPNTFDETVYTSYKCYNYMIKYIEKLDVQNKTEILTRFAALENL